MLTSPASTLAPCQPEATLFGGMDWSGRANKGLCVTCIVAVKDLDLMNEECSRVRRKFGMSQSQEFHGHTMSADMITALLAMGQSLNAVVAALLRHPPALHKDEAYRSHEAQALFLLNLLQPRYRLRQVWYDVEICGSQRQRTFETAAKRAHRLIYPDGGFRIHSRLSHLSNLIQLADVHAYALSWRERKSVIDDNLRQRLEGLESSVQNVIERV